MADSQNAVNEGEDRSRATEALESARDMTVSAYETARDRTRDAADQLTDKIGVYPVAAVVGGLALGGLVAYLVPSTRREVELLGATGRKLNAAARDAAQRGVEFGRERVDALAGEAVSKVGNAVVEAVGAKD